MRRRRASTCSPSPSPTRRCPGRARSTFAFDVKAAAGTVRVIAIDNAAGRLAGGPDGAQAEWIQATMEQARLAGFPSIVVGSTPLDDSQDAKPAEDAEEQIALLAGHASAYVATAGVDDPADRFFGGVLSRNVVQVPGAAAPLPLLQSSTLGYAPSRRFTNDPEDELSSRQTDAALLMIDVGVGRLDPTTGVAPVDVVSEPLLQGLAIDEGSRAIPLGWAIPLFVSAERPQPAALSDVAGTERAAPAGQPESRHRPDGRPVPVLPGHVRNGRPVRAGVHVRGTRRSGASSRSAREGVRPRVSPRSCSTPPGTSSTIPAASSAHSRSGRSTSP